MKSRNKKRLLALVLCMVVAISNSSFIFASETGETQAPQEAAAQTENETVTQDAAVETYAEEATQPVEESQPVVEETATEAEPVAQSEESAPAVEEQQEQPTAETPTAEASQGQETTTVEQDTPQEATETQQETPEGITVSEAAELKQEFKDSDGNVVETVTAKLPEGAFEAAISDVTMEVEKLDEPTEKHMVDLIQAKLPEERNLGNYVFYNITFKVNGEKTDPKKQVELTFQGADLTVRESDETHVCCLTPAKTEAEQDELTEIISKEDLEKNLQEEGKSTEDLSTYQYFSLQMKEDSKTVDQIFLKGTASTIYGVYIDEKVPTLSYEDDNVTIKVSAVKEGAIPEGTSLSVVPLEKDSEEYAKVEKHLNESAEDKAYSIAGFFAYDITLVDLDGNKIEPDGNVKVTMNYKKEAVPETVTENSNDLDVSVVHLEEDNTGNVKQVIDMVADADEEATVEKTDDAKITKAEFITDSFSDYAIAWYAYDSESGLNTVETVDHTQDGITLKMTNLYGDSQKIGASQENEEWIDIGGGYGNGTIKRGLLKSVLVDGYPVATKKSKSLKSLFDGSETRTVNNLFLKTTYDTTGYYEYSSFQNYAWLDTSTNKFKVYDAIGTPSNENRYYYQRGNFMPYNKINSTSISTNKNRYDEDGNPLADTDSGYEKTLYKTVGTNDYQFGMYMSGDFLQPKDGKVSAKQGSSRSDMIYEFNGDDDMWIYIDNVLVLDIGGVHDAHSGKINFSTGEVSWKDCTTGATPKETKKTIREMFQTAKQFPDGTPWDDSKAEKYFTGDTFKNYTTHSFKMFYMERGAGASNLHMKFNLQTIPEGKIEVRKELSNTDKEKYSNVNFAFQVYAQKIESMDKKGNETYYDDQYELLNKATYKDTGKNVTFSNPTIDEKTYKNVFYLKPDQSAVFSGLKANRKYYVVEVGVNAQEYDKIIINDVEYKAFDENDQDIGTISDVKTDEKTVEARPVVVCTNNCSLYNSRELRITKQMQTGQTTDDTFSFKIQLSDASENPTLIPYANGNYYLKDGSGNYYYWENGTLKSNRTTAKICGMTDANGVVSGVPVGYTVVITQILSETNFQVEEVNLDRDKYWEAQKTVNVESCDTATVASADGKIALKKDAQVTVVNRIKEPAVEDKSFIEVSKTFEGLTREQIKKLANAYQITVTNGSDTRTLKMDSENMDQNLIGNDTIWTYTWKLENCLDGTYHIKEINYQKDGYQVTAKVNGSDSDTADVTTEKATVTYKTTKKETTCSQQDYIVGSVNLIVAKLTQSAGYFVWTRDPANVNTRLAIVDLINNRQGIGFNPAATLSNCSFFSGLDKISSTLTFRDGEIQYDGTNNLHFDASRQWAMFATGTYTITGGSDAEVQIVNTYTEQTADLDLVKTSASENGEELKLDGAEFRLYKKDTSGTYQLSNENIKVNSKTNPDEVELEALQPGQYYLEEVKAPEAYILLADKIYFKQEKGKIYLTDRDGKELSKVPEMWNLNENSGKYILTVKNQIIYDLPSTGHTGIFNILMSGILLMFAGILIIYKMKGKEVLKNKKP